ncbi:hypothetical protein EDD99_6481 [Streptomyces sp. 846.5]|nr:hypothetical protein EDD99_6481 [Streptomyces sp. 846.5]
MCYGPFQYRSIQKFLQINDWIGNGTAVPDARTEPENEEMNHHGTA